ncbi:MAG: D-aminoacylase [Gammaproteobacteria bacterium]|nr:D-aminoacylase [Gammaproteobacteria bacterium]
MNANGTSFDTLIAGATVIDGSGAKGFKADVGIKGDRIAAVGDLAKAETSSRMDASECVIAPGFIDAHTHDDRAVLSGPRMTPKVSQGVTTVVTGNCGVSLAPLVDRNPPPPLNLLGDRSWFRYGSMREYVDEVRGHPPAVNMAMLVGHSTLRTGVMRDLDRPASAREIDGMTRRLEEAMEAGCIGMSTGLAYPPAFNAPTDEIVELAACVARHGGIYTTHMRNERDGVLDSVRETLEIGKRAGVPVVISHHKCCGKENFGLTAKTLPLITEARKSQQVNLDVYPYTASSTVLLADWVGGAEKVLITWSEPHPECAGQTFEEIRKDWGVSVEEAAQRLQPAGAIYYQMDEADLRRVLAFEDAMIGSDGLPHDTHPHPRLWGTFPRVLGHYARDQKLFPLEQAVRRMTSVPASVFGLEHRGTLSRGAYADLVVFDPEAIIDAATFESPALTSPGIEMVMVNGRPVWRNGGSTDARPGRVLSRAA